MTSPTEKSLLPGSTKSRVPSLRPSEKFGSFRLFDLIEIFSLASTSETLRFFSASRTASLISPRARRRKRCRLPRDLDLGLRRRSTMFISELMLLESVSGGS